MSAHEPGATPMAAQGGILGQVLYVQSKMARLEKLVALQANTIDMLQAQVTELIEIVTNKGDG